MGRTALAAGMHRYEVDGPWGTSVQAVPHRSQHSVASTLSLAFGVQGPCIGVGSGHGCDTEILLASLAMLNRRQSHGTWLVMSGFEPELEIDHAGKPVSNSSCVAVALALVPGDGPSHGKLRLDVAAPLRHLSSDCPSGPLAAFAGLIPRVGTSPLREASVIGYSIEGISWQLNLRAPQSSLVSSSSELSA